MIFFKKITYVIDYNIFVIDYIKTRNTAKYAVIDYIRR